MQPRIPTCIHIIVIIKPQKTSSLEELFTFGDMHFATGNCETTSPLSDTLALHLLEKWPNDQ